MVAPGTERHQVTAASLFLKLITLHCYFFVNGYYLTGVILPDIIYMPQISLGVVQTGFNKIKTTQTKRKNTPVLLLGTQTEVTEDMSQQK